MANAAGIGLLMSQGFAKAVSFPGLPLFKAGSLYCKHASNPAMQQLREILRERIANLEEIKPVESDIGEVKASPAQLRNFLRPI